MLISWILLGVLGVMVLSGLGRPVLNDFRIKWWVGILFLALVIGLNFIPQINAPGFSFSIGTLLFYACIFLMFFFFGKISTQMTALALGLVFGGLIYAATRISLMTGNTYFGTSNWVYALVLGIIAFAITRNGKYAFLIAGIGMLLANLLCQIGAANVNLNYNFDWTMVACGTAFTLYALTSLALPRQSKLCYQFEAGKMHD